MIAGEAYLAGLKRRLERNERAANIYFPFFCFVDFLGGVWDLNVVNRSGLNEGLVVGNISVLILWFGKYGLDYGGIRLQLQLGTAFCLTIVAVYLGHSKTISRLAQSQSMSVNVHICGLGQGRQKPKSEDEAGLHESRYIYHGISSGLGNNEIQV